METLVDTSKRTDYDELLHTLNTETGVNDARLEQQEIQRLQSLELRAKKIKRKVSYVWKSFDDDRNTGLQKTDTEVYVRKMSRTGSLPEDFQRQLGTKNYSSGILSKKSIGSGDPLSLSLRGAQRPRRARRMSCPGGSIQFNEGWEKFYEGDADVPKISGMDRLLPPKKRSSRGILAYFRKKDSTDGAVTQNEWETLQINVVAGGIYICIMIWYLNVHTEFDLGRFMLGARLFLNLG